MGLTKEENEQLALLLKKMDSPLSSEVFKALMEVTVSVPIELAVLDQRHNVLMIYRKDQEYDGYHLPGTVLRNTDTVDIAINRLIKNEISGTEVTPPVFIGLKEILKGSGVGQNPTRHEISLIHVCWLLDKYQGDGQFFPINQLPHNVLSHHYILLGIVKDWLSRLR